MRALVQRVWSARVEVEEHVVGQIERGLLVYVGVATDDTSADVAWLADRIAGLRIFPDEAKPLNRSVQDVGGALLVVSAFSLMADARKGRRPTLDGAAGGELAMELYEACCALLRGCGVPVETGQFAANMQVHSVNDGPILTLLDSRKQF